MKKETSNEINETIDATINKTTNKTTNKEKVNRKIKQIFAWIGIVVIALLYIASFMLSVLNIPGSQKMFEAALVSTLLVPLIIYVFLWISKLMKERSEKEQKKLDDMRKL